MLGHARIPASVVSSIQATTTTTRTTGISSARPTVPSSIPPTRVIQTTTSTTILASTAASTSPSALTAGLDQSAKIGIGVGISFGTLLVALLSFIAFRLFRNSQSKPPDLGRADEDTAESKNLEQSNINTWMQLRHELTATEPATEMYTIHNTPEVEAKPVTRELWYSGLEGR